MSWIDILGQNTGERGLTFPQISTGTASYWEEFVKMEILTLIEYDLEGADLKEILLRKYSTDIVRQLLIMVLICQEVNVVIYSVEDLHYYTL